MNFRQAMQIAFPATELTPSIESAVRGAIQAKLEIRRRTVRTRFAAIGVAATTLIVAAALTLGPTALAVARLNRIAGSVGDVRTAKFEKYAVDQEGNLRLQGRTYYDSGKWRIEHGAELTLFDNGTLWSYDIPAKRVTMHAKRDGPYAHNPSGFNVRTMLADMARWNWKQKIETGSTLLEGRKVESVTITEDSGRERSIILADPATHLPLLIKSEGLTAKGWRLTHLSKTSFDEPIEPALFARSFPSDVAIVDAEAERSAWLKKLETPSEEFDLSNSHIGIRDVSMNSRGHVFILYTDGETEEGRNEYARRVSERRLDFEWRVPPEIAIKDSLGTRFQQSEGTFQPYVDGPSKRFRNGIVLRDGQVLQGAWFVPASYVAWKPRSLQIEMRSRGGSKAQSREIARRFQEPTATVIPAWMSMIAMGPKNLSDLLMAERRLERSASREKGDWARVENTLREDLAEILDRERRGSSYAKGEIYFELYRALLNQGKRGEALEFLQLAAGETQYPNQYPAPNIREALKKEGLQ